MNWKKLFANLPRSTIQDEKELLHLACKNSNLRAVEGIVNAISPDKYSSLQHIGGKSTLLHYAALHGWQDMVERSLVQFGCDINATNNNGYTALNVACLWNQEEVALYLINNGADCTLMNSFHSTPLHSACRRNNTTIVKALIAKGIDVNSSTDICHSPLHLCCRNGTSDMAELLLDTGAHVSHGVTIGNECGDYNDDYYSQRTAVDCYAVNVALSSGNYEVLKVLLSRGGKLFHIKRNLDSFTDWGVTGSIESIYRRPEHVELLRLWLKLPRFDSKGKIYTVFSKHSPCIVAFEGNNVEGLQCILITTSVSEEEISKALHGFIPSVDVLKVLLEHCCSRNIEPELDSRGRTPLHNLLRSCHLSHYHQESPRDAVLREMIELFVSHGVDINAQDKEGRTPLYYVVHDGCEVCWMHALLLISLGADDVPDKVASISKSYINRELGPIQYLTDPEKQRILREAMSDRPMVYILK